MRLTHHEMNSDLQISSLPTLQHDVAPAAPNITHQSRKLARNSWPTLALTVALQRFLKRWAGVKSLSYPFYAAGAIDAPVAPC